MNRLASSPPSKPSWHPLIPTPPPHSVGAVLAPEPIRAAIAAPLATFLPVHYESGYAYPLLVWLHNSGESEQHLSQVMQHLSTQNYVAVAPRAPQENQPCGTDGFNWVQHPEAIAEAEEAVDEAIASAEERFHVHPDRIFLIGHGEGGSMALRLALQSPRRFAGVASIGGSLPRFHQPFRNINQLRHLPFFLASSRECRQYSEVDVCRDLKLLHAAGCSVALRQYPGADDLTTTMLSDINGWVMDHVCGP